MKKINGILIVLALLAFVGALAYLPYANKFGYFNDDWYEMYAAKIMGPQVFHGIFSVDRPLRAYVMIPAYILFGENPLGYSLSAYLFRVLGGLALWWMLDMIWPKAKFSTVLMAVLFIIYPGFGSQPNAIDYQSHIIALMLALLSLALTVKAFQIDGARWKMVTLLAVSALLGWAYLGLMEYYIGFEVIRALLLLLLTLRVQTGWRDQAKRFLLGWLPLSLIGISFVFWRVFIFVGERKATNASVQLSTLRSSPLETVLAWSNVFIESFLGTLIYAWHTPLFSLLHILSNTELMIGLGLGLLAIFACYFVLKNKTDEDHHWRFEALWLGLASVVAGLIVIILANRQVGSPYSSRYTLISSMGVVMVLMALISLLPGKILRAIAISCVILVGTLTQFNNSVLAARKTEANNHFWWQVSWRIPQLKPGTTLVAHYQWVNAEEDYFIWGPANQIYFPKRLSKTAVWPSVYGAIANSGNMQNVITRSKAGYDKRRTINLYTNFRTILILTQPTFTSCVQMIDGGQPELSTTEWQNIVTMAPFSSADQILLDEPFHTPPQVIFGAEPAHNWCYFYQKASLARQRGDWKTVVALGEQAFKEKYLASDPIEWMPFLQGYAITANTSRVAQIANQLKAQPAVQAQACQILSKMSGLSANVQKQVQTLLCAP